MISNKEASKIYREAARIIQSEEMHFSCWAVGRAFDHSSIQGFGNRRNLINRYEATFKDEADFWNSPRGGCYKQQRVMALLMMSEYILTLGDNNDSH